jgi:hypothetical protein
MRVIFFLASAAFALSAAAFACSTPAQAAETKADAPPTGVTPAALRLADVLAAHEKAAGSLAPGPPNTVVERWSFVDSGLSGTEDLERSGEDYRSTITAGPFVERFGQHGADRWHQNANGFTSVTTALDERSFYAVRVLEDAADPKNDVTVLGQTAGDHPAYVLAVKLPGRRHPEWVFYDKSTWQIVRIESVSGTHRLVETYDDFRTTGGVTQAWHVHDSDGRPELDDDFVLQSLKQGVSIPPETFSEPAHAPAISRVTQETQIPAHTHLFGYVVRMMVHGRGLDFLLDSASPHSIIDRDVARDMNLPTFGQTTQLKDGKQVEYRTIIADGDIGPIHLHNFVVDSERFVYQPNESTRVVGTLGYDFFASNILRFDFVNGTLTAFPVLGFDGARPVEGGIDVPFSIDDGTPLTTIRIGDTLAAHSIVDTASPWTMLFGAFVDAHQSQLEDVDPGGKHGHGVVPFDDDGTFGSEAEIWEARAKDFMVATTAYPKALVVATTYNYSLHNQDIEAIVGMDYMYFFDLYFDYPNGRLILKPNKLFYDNFKPAK